MKPTASPSSETLFENVMVPVAKALCRALFRWAHQHAAIPVPLQRAHVLRALPDVHLMMREPMSDEDAGSAVRTLARLAFRHPDALSSPDALDRGIEALKVLNTRYHSTMQSMRELREEHLRTNVKYRIGHVFKHRKFHYRGVIYGYDVRCERDAAWQSKMGVTNPDQPFYYVLPDSSDSIRLFGGTRLSKYVAEENVGELGEDERGKGITHQALVNYFEGFRERETQYKPNKRLTYEYAQDRHSDGDTSQTDADLVRL